MQKIIIVDDTDKIIGFKLRNEIDYLVDSYRWSGVWIANSNNQVLMAQRKLTRDKDPGMWGPAVAGTLEEGETYESNAYKEVEEEIGLKNIILELGPKERLTTPRKSFGQWFFCRVDNPISDFVLQEEEVEQIVWINKEDLLRDVKSNPGKYSPVIRKGIDSLILF